VLPTEHTEYTEENPEENFEDLDDWRDLRTVDFSVCSVGHPKQASSRGSGQTQKRIECVRPGFRQKRVGEELYVERDDDERDRPAE